MQGAENVSQCCFGLQRIPKDGGDSPLHSVGDQNKASVHHVPLIPGQLVDIVGYDSMLGNAHSL